MEVSRPRVPITLLIVIAVLLVLGILAGPFINSRMTEEQLADNVFINAVPFVLIFVAIILTFIAIIVVVASMLDNNISPRVHRIIESILIAGIVLGVVGMFQPWFFEGYKYGFILLLISTLCFILWSHITPKREVMQEEAISGPLSETPKDNL
jgi:Na+-driven multidrug efflux pump